MVTFKAGGVSLNPKDKMKKKEEEKKEVPPIGQAGGFGGGAGGGAGGGEIPKTIFDPNKKEVQTDGAVYPTINPDFKPTLTPTEKIVFNQDGSVKVTSKTGQDFNLSKEEYAGTLKRGGGFITPKTQQLEQQQQQKSPSLSDEPIQERFAELTANNNQVDLRGTFLEPVARGTAIFLEKASAFLPTWAQLGTSKSIDVKKAENAFTSVTATINDDIKLYQAGAISRAQVEQDIDRALNYNLDLYKQTKGMGQANLRFWLDKGQEIEAQIIEQLRNLENQRRSLNLI
jgi:hypothetical protein